MVKLNSRIAACCLSPLAAMMLWACSDQQAADPGNDLAAAFESASFPHEASDIAADPAVRYGVLDNGLRYAILENDTPTGTAALRMVFDVGSLAEEEDQRGLAHFIEHMAFNGTTHVPEGEMVALLERYGLAFGAVALEAAKQHARILPLARACCALSSPPSRPLRHATRRTRRRWSYPDPDQCGFLNLRYSSASTWKN